jgi:hypothetical protein
MMSDATTIMASTERVMIALLSTLREKGIVAKVELRKLS